MNTAVVGCAICIKSANESLDFSIKYVASDYQCQSSIWVRLSNLFQKPVFEPVTACSVFNTAVYFKHLHP